MSHLATALAVALAAVGQSTAAARADDLLVHALLAPPELSWTDVLGPVTTMPPAETAPPVLATYDDPPNKLLSPQARSPGLQFSLDPDNAELFLGWHLEF